MILQEEIQAFANRIVECLQPEKVILFGSYAYGDPTPDSDVDLLVVMDFQPGERKSLEIRKALDFSFSLDLIVKTPQDVERRYQGYDPLIRHALNQGKVLYDRGI